MPASLKWPVADVRGYFEELERDHTLADHVRFATSVARRSRLADNDVRFGRRLAWCALARAKRPSLVVETGTDKGLGSLVFAAALLRNGTGRLVTIDVNPDSGELIGGPYAAVIDRLTGDSVSHLEKLGTVDIFLHDSLHTDAHETAEYAGIGSRLAEDALCSATTPPMPSLAGPRQQDASFSTLPSRQMNTGTTVEASEPPGAKGCDGAP